MQSSENRTRRTFRQSDNRLKVSTRTAFRPFSPTGMADLRWLAAGRTIGPASNGANMRIIDDSGSECRFSQQSPFHGIAIPRVRYILAKHTTQRCRQASALEENVTFWKIVAVVSTCLGIASGSQTWAQEPYPNRVITLVHGFGPAATPTSLQGLSPTGCHNA